LWSRLPSGETPAIFRGTVFEYGCANLRANAKRR
jgi:hypothetical protein